ncbi:MULTISPECIES: hypothetical protein [Pseudomonas]|uniref:Uncharacterized protein n=1 Tax=Pseudomonas baetica TaxID=674054 RepID=A0ABX4Q8A4_9PSED|nr:MULTISPECIES: hypothetical protein [Pseudomonas]PKA73016.1 hypothetical protein ATI02_6127 [Pseudomonas baetica]
MALNERRPGSGTLTASVDGRGFLNSTSVTFHDANKHYLIAGYDGNDHWVVFSVPSSLVGEGPHVVNHYDDGLTWTVNVDGVNNFVASGTATITFDKYRISVRGTFDFSLEDKRRVVGEFDIANKQAA